MSAAALVVALAALGAGVWALLRTSSSNSPAPPPSAQQIADAKTKACGAYKTASAAVKSNNNADPGSEPKAAAANARLALVLAHFYLLERLDPATPAPLADAIRKYADNLEESMILVLGGAAGDDPAVSGRVQELEPLNNQIIELCK
ncbi:hypothetical protein A5662_14240 [Mycobacteriaceae bacterium 1482268.1]|nr:hypothetical protein A5662_14240 [Mycobacteriaceae bacterium 1482268.1]